MSKCYKIAGSSNWKAMVFLLINKLTCKGYVTHFSRTQLLRSSNIQKITNFSILIGHKHNPEHVEETIQRTLQDLRDEGCLEFKGNGEYEITSHGIRIMQEKIDSAETRMKEFFGIISSRKKNVIIRKGNKG
jgi:hypothetical protein